MTFAAAPAAQITADEAIDAIAAAGGDQLVAAERLHVQPEQLAGIIASDPLAFRRLQDQMRILALLDASQTLSLVNVATRAAIATLEGKDLVNLQGRLLEAIGKLTDDKTTTTNINSNLEVLLRALPPDVRESFIALAAPDPNADAIDGVFSSEFDAAPAPNAAVREQLT